LRFNDTPLVNTAVQLDSVSYDDDATALKKRCAPERTFHPPSNRGLETRVRDMGPPLRPAESGMNYKIVGTDPDLKRWAMDISNGALNETFHHWGDSGEEIEVICGDSKPLAASAEIMRDIESTPMPEDWKGGHEPLPAGAQTPADKRF
jgi:hypothetical protein